MDDEAVEAKGKMTTAVEGARTQVEGEQQEMSETVRETRRLCLDSASQALRVTT